MGTSFAVGWSACVGPILVGILGMGAILGDIGYAALLMLFYALGSFVPLLILSLAYDRFNLSQWLEGKGLTFSWKGKEVHLPYTNLIAGLLLILVGIALIVYKGTSFVNTIDIFGTKAYFYTTQRALLEWKYANMVGAGTLAAMVIAIAGFWWWRRKERKTL